jgi:flagellar hook-associated protein 2
VLTGNGGDGAATDGLVIRVAGSTTGDRGTIAITKGVAEELENLLEFLTASVTGIVSSRIDNIEDSIDFIEDRIEHKENRLDSKRDRLTNQFVSMETSLAALQTINNFITQTLLLVSG